MEGQYTEWGGATNEPPTSSNVDIVFRDGSVVHNVDPCLVSWRHTTLTDLNSADVVAYRIHDPNAGWIIREPHTDFDEDDVPDGAGGNRVDVVNRNPLVGVEFRQDPENDVNWSIDKDDLNNWDVIEWRVTPKVDTSEPDDEGYFNHDPLEGQPDDAKGIFVDIIDDDGDTCTNQEASDWDWDEDSHIVKWRPHLFILPSQYTMHAGDGMPDAVDGKKVHIIFRDYDTRQDVDAEDYSWGWEHADYSTGDIMGYIIADTACEPTSQTEDERWTEIEPGKKPDFDSDVSMLVKCVNGELGDDGDSRLVDEWTWELDKEHPNCIAAYRVVGPWIVHDGKSVPLDLTTKIVAVERSGYQYFAMEVNTHRNELVYDSDSKRPGDIVRYVITKRQGKDLDGWIPTIDFQRPDDLPSTTFVKVKLRNGEEPSEGHPISRWRWGYSNSPSDIAAYKIVPDPRVAPKPTPSKDKEMLIEASARLAALTKAIAADQAGVTNREATVVVNDLDYVGQRLEGKWVPAFNAFKMENGDVYDEQFLLSKGAIIYERQ